MSESPNAESLQNRLDRLQELTEFTEKCRKRLKDIFDSLGWSWNYEDANELDQCPQDPEHRVPSRSLEQHRRACSLRREGYPPEEQAEMVDAAACYQNSSVRTFTMDRSTQQQVILQARSAAPMMKMEGVFWQGQYSSHAGDVPQNHKRTICDLSVADRLALYDHVMGVLKGSGDAPASSGQDDLYVDWVSRLQKGDEQNEPKTHLELMAEMRDYKRRRQSYRAKNVHITKKSYTEVIREVINVHSEQLGRQWREEEEEEEREEEARSREDRSREDRSQASSHRRRSSSSESRPAGRRERSEDGESSRRRRERGSRSPEDRRRDRKKKKKKKKSRKEEKDGGK